MAHGRRRRAKFGRCLVGLFLLFLGLLFFPMRARIPHHFEADHELNIYRLVHAARFTSTAREPSGLADAAHNVARLD